MREETTLSHREDGVGTRFSLDDRVPARPILFPEDQLQRACSERFLRFVLHRLVAAGVGTFDDVTRKSRFESFSRGIDLRRECFQMAVGEEKVSLPF